MRRATPSPKPQPEPQPISIHALHAESDYRQSVSVPGTLPISIHALHAESDFLMQFYITHGLYFNPRSPCGERQAWYFSRSYIDNFNPRSPCGERRYSQIIDMFWHEISIHALHAESDRRAERRSVYDEYRFQSTLSMRRATAIKCDYYYRLVISIHALHAESDFCTT